MLTKLSELTNTLVVANLAFRGFRGPEDYPGMIAVLHGSKDADQLEDVDTLETLTNRYAHLVNCDPYHDMLTPDS